jgi:hypothetical protein
MVLSGAATVDTLRQNVGAFRVPRDAVLDPALDALSEVTEKYWDQRQRLPWR